jgi:nucleoside-diphosphate-sugar epimerase
LRHLVTGGSGFLGNLIARRLLQRGEEVRILDVWEDPHRSREMEFVACDIRDRAGVARAMKGVDVVHHNVALVPLTKSGTRFHDVNVGGSRIAAEEASAAGVGAFIHMSSSAIFGTPGSDAITPDTRPAPVEIYGRAKLEGERAVRGVLDGAGVPLIVIRPRTILGEGRLGIFQIMFDWIAQARDVYVVGSGDVPFQFVHAHDLMDFYMLALDRQEAGAYNVGTDRYGTLREGLENLIRHAGTTSRVRSLPVWPTVNGLRFLDWLHLSPLAPWHYLTYHRPFHFDPAPLHALGWKARYSNDEMFRESYDWFLAHRDDAREAAGGSPHRKAVPEMVLRLVKWLS